MGGDALTIRSAVFFDRDGVLNKAVVGAGRPYPPGDASEFALEEGASEAVERLAAQFAYRFVVSNQPDVARGTARREDVEALNARLNELLDITKFYTCFHDDADRCRCRKPLPGMLELAAREYDIDLTASFMVGDRWRDIDAGAAAGCTTILIDRDYDERAPVERPDIIVRSITEAADAILATQDKRQCRGGVLL